MLEGERVRFDRGLIRELIASIPESITMHARDPEKSLEIGGNNSIFVPMTGAPFLTDLENNRRMPTLDDLANFHKLSHMLPAIHSSAHHIVEPMDHAISHRHLRITYSSMKHSDKTFMGMTSSGKNAEDVIEMCKILFGEKFIGCSNCGTSQCGGFISTRIHSGYPKRSTCDLWSLFSYSINAVWCSNGRDARNLSDELYDWSNGKTL
jgi:trimethylamine--corrinoid protein Co-methyltransferase